MILLLLAALTLSSPTTSDDYGIDILCTCGRGPIIISVCTCGGPIEGDEGVRFEFVDPSTLNF